MYDKIKRFFWCAGKAVLPKVPKWIAKAAGLDLVVDMGVKYRNGHGVAKDDVQAAAWYRKAAEQGRAIAQVNLAVMYEIGKGVAKDQTIAIHW